MTELPKLDEMWRRDESLRSLDERLREQPGAIRVVSFDFFDTLVHRLCGEPADLFVEVGRRLAGRNLLLQPLSPLQFRDLRVAADLRARQAAQAAGKPVEVALPAFYEQMRQIVRDPADALAVELETERDLTFLNPCMAGLVRHVRSLGFKTAIISDTYFSREHILGLLRGLGMPPELFDTILLSHESGGGKWQGHLFRVACRHFDIHPNELLHIGDNPGADVQMAAAMGAEPVLYYRTTPGLDEVFAAERSLLNPAHPPGASLQFVRLLAARLADSADDAYRDGAFVFGPVLTRYAEWCVQRLAATGVRKVLALMREGELLGELVSRAAVSAGVKLEVVPCFVSRLSTARASLPEVSIEQIDRLLEGHTGLTMHSILEILGILEEAQSYLDREMLMKPLVTPDAIRSVVKLLAKPGRLHDLIDASRRRSHELAFSYLDQLTDGEDIVGVVDLGWSGSIQRNLTRILRLGGRKVRSVGCYLATTPRAATLFLDGDEAHAYFAGPWMHSTILPEIAITACIGSTNDYQRLSDGQAVPVLGAYSIADSERALKQRLRDGVLTFQTLWQQICATRRLGGITADMWAEIDGASASVLGRLLDFPSAAEAWRLGALNHDENYWGGRLSRPLCAVEGRKKLHEEGVRGLFLNPDSYWPQGVVARYQSPLITVLAQRWNNGVAFGLIGSDCQGEGAQTEDELQSLCALLSELKPQQILYFGRSAVDLRRRLGKVMCSDGCMSPDNVSKPKTKTLAPSVPMPSFSHEDETHWPAAVNSTELKLIVLDASGEPSTHSADLCPCLELRGDLRTPAVLKAVRSALDISARSIALVLSDELPGTVIEDALNALAPFLGPQGTIFLGHGRCTWAEVNEHRSTQLSNDWLERVGKDLGFELWRAPSGLRWHAFNWTTLVRGQAVREAASYWALTPRELPLLPPVDDLCVPTGELNEPALLSSDSVTVSVSRK